MPEIKQYTRQILPRQMFEPRNAKGIDFGADQGGTMAMANAIGDLGKGMDQLKIRLDEIQERKDKALYLKNLSDFELSNMKRAQELFEQEYASDEEIAAAYQSDYEERAAVFAESVPESMQERWASDYGNMRMGFTKLGMQEQIRRAGVRAQLQFDDASDNINSMLAQGLIGIDEAREKFNELATTLPISSIDRQALVEDKIDNALQTKATISINKDPYEFKRDVQAGVYNDMGDLERYIVIADNEIQRLKDRDDAETNKALAASEKALRRDDRTGKPADPAKSALLRQEGVDGKPIERDLSSAVYIGGQLQYQQEVLGQSPANTRILTENEAEIFSSNLNGLDNVEDFEKAYAETIGIIPEQYRAQFIQDLIELGSLQPSTQLLIETDPIEDGIVRQAAFEIRTEERRNQIMEGAERRSKASDVGSKVTDLERSVMNNIAGYKHATFMAQNVAYDITQMEGEIVDIAKYFYYTKGYSVEDSANMATKWLTRGSDIVQNKDGSAYMIPETTGYTSKDVEAKAIAIKKDVIDVARQKDNLDMPPGYNSSPAMRSTYYDHLEQGSYWANNQDNSGIVLMYGNAPVIRADGSLIDIPFGVINSYTEPTGVVGAVIQGGSSTLSGAKELLGGAGDVVEKAKDKVKARGKSKKLTGAIEAIEDVVGVVGSKLGGGSE